MKKLSILLATVLLVMSFGTFNQVLATTDSLFANLITNLDTPPTSTFNAPTVKSGVNVATGTITVTTDLSTFTVYAVMAYPTTGTNLPAIIHYHGATQAADEAVAIKYAQAGFVCISADLPGIAETSSLTRPEGVWKGPYVSTAPFVVTPNVTNSALYNAIATAISSYKVLRGQANVDKTKIGASGISYGAYTATLVSGLLGTDIKGTYALYGCGFFDKGTTFGDGNLAQMNATDRATWYSNYDAGNKASNITNYFSAAASNDIFFYPTAINATVEGVGLSKSNQVFSPNQTHSISNLAKGATLDVKYFESILKGGAALPKVTAVASEKPNQVKTITATISGTTSGTPTAKLWYASPKVFWSSRVWESIDMPVVGTTASVDVSASIVNMNSDWFVTVTDDNVDFSTELQRNLGVLTSQIRKDDVIINGDIEYNTTGWYGSGLDINWTAGGYNGSNGYAKIATAAGYPTQIKTKVQLVQNEIYDISFAGKSLGDTISGITFMIWDGANSYTTVLQSITFSNSWQTYLGQYKFTGTSGEYIIIINLSGPGRPEVCIDDVRMKKASITASPLKNPTFDSDINGWSTMFPSMAMSYDPTSGVGGSGCLKNVYTATTGHIPEIRQSVCLEANKIYNLSFAVKHEGTTPLNVELYAFYDDGTYKSLINKTGATTTSWQTIGLRLQKDATKGSSVNLRLRIGSNSVSNISYVDDFYMTKELESIMPNGGFENTSYFSGWSTSYLKVGNAPYIAKATGSIGTGASTVILTGGQTGGFRMRTTGTNVVTFKAGQQYKVSALVMFDTRWVRGKDVTIGAINSNSTISIPIATGTVGPVQNKWYPIEGYYTPDTDKTDYQLYLDFGVIDATTGANNVVCFQLDDVSVTPIPTVIINNANKPIFGNTISFPYTFTGVSNYLEEDSSYKMSLGDETNGWVTIGSGITNANYSPLSYTPSLSDVGKRIKLEITPKDQQSLVSQTVTYTTSPIVKAYEFTNVGGTATFTFTNPNANSQDTALILAVYNGNIMEDVAVNFATVLSNGSLTVTINGITAGKTVKPMAWDSLESMKPYTID